MYVSDLAHLENSPYKFTVPQIKIIMYLCEILSLMSLVTGIRYTEFIPQ